MGLAVLVAVASGVLFRMLPGEAGLFLAEQVLQPIFNSIHGIISFIASPLIFLTVLLGVVNAGSVSSLSRIGTRMMAWFFGLLGVAAVLLLACTLPFLSLRAENWLSIETAG